jgi:hypothetical protein
MAGENSFYLLRQGLLISGWSKHLTDVEAMGLRELAG